MQTITLSGVLDIQGPALQAAPVRLTHDFGRPVNIASVRLVSFSYPFAAHAALIRGQFEFSLLNLDADSRNQCKLTMKHRLAPYGTVDADLPLFGDLVKSYTWSCPFTSVINADGVFTHDFATTEAKTRVTPPAPFFAHQLEVELRFQELRIPVGFAYLPPSSIAGALTITLEITEA